MRKRNICMCLLFIVMMSLLIYGCNDNRSENIGRIGDFEVKESKTIPKSYEISKYFGSESTPSIPSKYKDKNIVGIGSDVFANCLNIERINISSNIKYIGGRAFSGCNNLEKVTFNEGLKEIGQAAFYRTAIEKVKFPSTLIKIDSKAFSHCQCLLSVTFNEGLKEIGGDAFRKTKISKIETPSSLDSIGSSAFELSDLETVILNERLKKIGSSAFGDTSIEEIIIPKFVDEMGEGVFFKCSSLKKIYCKVKLKPIGWREDWNLYNIEEINPSYNLYHEYFHDVVWGYVG